MENNKKNDGAKQSNKFLAALLRGLKAFFTRNMVLKIVSLLFAMLLWSYVMMETNPSRTKTVGGVSASFEGENELLAKHLVVRGDYDDILNDVSVRVSTELTKFNNLNANSVNATVNLRTINKPGTYKLKITATAADGGDVLDITPEEISVEVGDLASRTLPVEVEYAGKLPEDYWHASPVLNQTAIVIQGAEEDVEQVVKAVCSIDLSGLYATFNQSVVLSLRDASGNEMSNSMFLDSMPSVVVKMEVLKTRTLTVDAAGAVLGMDALPANYTLHDVVATPATVRVAGKSDVIDALTSIATETMDVSGKKESVKENLALVVPEGIVVLDEVESISMYADIREVTEERTFTDLPIAVKGLGRKLTASLSAEQSNVTISGRITLIRLLGREDVDLYVDASGLTAGQHELEVLVSLPTEAMTTELIHTLTVPRVTVTIK